MTKFKDVAKHYIGCRVKTENDGVIDYDFYDSYLDTDIGSYSNDKNYRSDEVKPILRKLSDMTEDEAIELLGQNEYYDFSIDSEIQDIDDGGVNFIQGLQGLRHDFTNSSPKEFIWLLSKHFDLFGLIESGQAIDASTLK